MYVVYTWISGGCLKLLSENNGYKNKNISDDGDAPTTYSEFSDKRLNDEFAGILSFKWYT